MKISIFSVSAGLTFAFVVSLLAETATAEPYTTIDSDLGLYCEKNLDDTQSLVRATYNKKTGAMTVTGIDPELELAAIRKLIKTNQKKVGTLRKIKRDNDPTRDIKTLFKLAKYVSDDGFSQTKPNKVYKAISGLINQLNARIDELLGVLEMIERCRDNQDVIPPPQPGSAEVITFSFVHPDYRTVEVMRGLGVTAVLDKKAITGQLCISTSKVHGTLSKAPYESLRTVTRNPCLIFWQTNFRKYPFCSYGPENTAITWFSSTDVGFSSSPVDEDERARLEGKLAHYGPINVRVPSKKYPCRVKK